MKKIIVSLFFLFTLASVETNAQQKVNNTVFQAGEELSFDLYFKYGIIYARAGYSSFKISAANYNKQEAYKATLLARLTGAAKKLFNLSDTLTSYMSKDLVPLEFRKNTTEGKNYFKENIYYTYNSNAGITIQTKRIKNGELSYDESMTATSSIYDMVSTVCYARTIDYGRMKKGTVTSIEFISSRKKGNMEIVYQGTEDISANDGNKYNCIKLVLNMSDAAFANKEEAMKVYITNDSNRMPIRLDTKLKYGTARAILSAYKGNKYAMKSIKE